MLNKYLKYNHTHNKLHTGGLSVEGKARALEGYVTDRS